MLNSLSPRATALLIGAMFFATIIGAWVFEYAGYLPCELCLLQRWAYYVVVPASLLVAYFNPPWIKSALLVIGLALVASAIFGAYHSGVEWKFWAGPQSCSSGSISDGLPDLGKPAVLCNEAAIRIAGLSLAGWNAVISAGLAVVAFAAARKSHGSSSVSQ